MLVNPELLRGLANEAEEASFAIMNANVRGIASTAADGLSGSTTQWAMRLLGEYMSGQATALAGNVSAMGRAVRGAGDRYEVEDKALGGSFDGLF